MPGSGSISSARPRSSSRTASSIRGASRLSLSVKQLEGRLELTYEDDGRGSMRVPGLGYGMRNLAKRGSADIGAALLLDSAPGKGCKAQINLSLSRAS